MAIVNAIAAWLHLLASVIWIGGMLFNFLVLLPSLVVIDPPPLRGKLVSAILARFGPIAWTAIAVLVVTGIIGTLRIISSPTDLVTTTEGITLLVKIVIALAMIGIAAVLGFVLSPKLVAMSAPAPVAAGGQAGPAGRPSAPPAKAMQLQNQIMALAKLNLMLGMLMLVVVILMRYV